MTNRSEHGVGLTQYFVAVLLELVGTVIILVSFSYMAYLIFHHQMYAMTPVEVVRFANSWTFYRAFLALLVGLFIQQYGVAYLERRFYFPETI